MQKEKANARNSLEPKKMWLIWFQIKHDIET